MWVFADNEVVQRESSKTYLGSQIALQDSLRSAGFASQTDEQNKQQLRQTIASEYLQPNTQSNPFTDYPKLSDLYYPSQDPSYIDLSVEYFIDSQQTVSNAVQVVGERMDQYFAGGNFHTTYRAFL